MAVTLDGLHPTLMRPRVEAVLADPDAKALGMYVVSAFRSIERQRALFAAAVKKHGSEAAARKWVAPPGKSNHGPKVDGFGTAVDFGIPGYKAVSGQWPPDLERKVNTVCARHGLFSPMEWEDWHFEPIPNWKLPSHPQEDLLMAAAKDDDDARWALVLQWFVDYLGRVPNTTEEHLLHVFVFGTKGAGACLAGIVTSDEAKAFRKMQRV